MWDFGAESTGGRESNGKNKARREQAIGWARGFISNSSSSWSPGIEDSGVHIVHTSREPWDGHEICCEVMAIRAAPPINTSYSDSSLMCLLL